MQAYLCVRDRAETAELLPGIEALRITKVNKFTFLLCSLPCWRPCFLHFNFLVWQQLPPKSRPFTPSPCAFLLFLPVAFSRILDILTSETLSMLLLMTKNRKKKTSQPSLESDWNRFDDFEALPHQVHFKHRKFISDNNSLIFKIKPCVSYNDHLHIS